MAKPPTIVDVAHMLGVAPSTVSRAFNNPRILKPDTVARVLAKAAELGYVPNRHAQALTTGRSGLVGLVIRDVSNPFFARAIRATQREAERLSLNAIVVECDSDADREQRLIDRVLPQVEGLVLASTRLSAARLTELSRRTRVVLVNSDLAGFTRVLASASEALDQGIRLLAGAGARKLAYVGGPPYSWSEAERWGTVRRVAAERGLAVTYVSANMGTYGEGRAAAVSIAEAEVDAVVAFDDVIAHGVLDGLTILGVRVPEDVRLLGCDDALPIETHPRLSTVRLDIEQAFVTAVRALAEGSVSGQRILVPGVLTVRETT
ncbi:MAG: LacI family DNA-binding transcriptional regulator [Propionibacteriaceae bacterium]